MSLVKLKDTKGNIIYFNPDHVLLLSGSVKDGAPIVGETAVVTVQGLTMAVQGTLAEVADQLNGREKSSLI